MNNINIFPTTNFPLASFLLSKGCKIVSVDKANPKRTIFNFQDSDLRKELTDKFLAYEALVEPHDFFNSQKDLKQLIYGDLT